MGTATGAVAALRQAGQQQGAVMAVVEHVFVSWPLSSMVQGEADAATKAVEASRQAGQRQAAVLAAAEAELSTARQAATDAAAELQVHLPVFRF